jgi:hypothetical protein
MNLVPRWRIVAGAVSGILVLALVALPVKAGMRVQSISGHVQSGSTPIKGSAVMLYVAGDDYGAGDTALGSASTDASGAFSISFSCPTGNPMTYVVAIGGDSGLGANSAIGLITVLNRCNAVRDGTTVTVNERTTMAAEWTLAQFSDITGQVIGAPMSNAAGIGNAARQANTDLVDTGTGNPAAFLPTVAQCGGSPTPVNCDGLERINTIANILAACVNSSGPLSYECSSLFENTGTLTGGTTLQAAHVMATNPTANVSALFALQPSLSPYAPTLTSAPTDWTLALNFAPAGAQFAFASLLAVDGLGNVWVTNDLGGAGCASGSAPCGSVSELTAASGYTTGLNFAPAGAAFNSPTTPVVDLAGNVWVSNFSGGAGCATDTAPCGSVSELTAASGYATGLNLAPASAQFDYVDSLAIDTAGNIWTINEGGGSGCASGVPPCGSVSELTASSGYTTGTNFAPQGAMFNFPLTLAVDSAGNVWVPNFIGDSVSELTASNNYSTGLNFSPVGAMFTGLVLSALDNAGNLWATNLFGGSGCDRSTLLSAPPCGSVSELTAISGYNDGLNFGSVDARIDVPRGIALDSAGNVWVANGSGGTGCTNSYARSNTPCGSLSELTVADDYATGLNFTPSGTGFDRPVGLAVDGAGDVWVTNRSGGAGCSASPLAAPCGSISEFIGLAKPVLTPTQACLQKGQNVCLP